MPAESPNDKLIMSLVERALGQPSQERESYVRGACAGDPALFEQVWNYVRWEERMKGFLVDPLFRPRDGELSAGSTVTGFYPGGRPGFTPGTILDQRYRIVNLLGRGGMGEVYRADDLLLEHPIAIKVVAAAATADTRAISRFRNEVRIARQVTHPNVCRVYDIGEADGLTFLTMEYVDGEDLASLLRRIGKLPLEKALEIARQLCAGLAAAHEKGVIHRDLKPANIMLDGKGHVRITDFGLAGLINQIRDAGSGTPAYMSPEQLADKDVTPRSDIYALGIVLHELLTGRRPPLKPGDAELDPAIGKVIGRCLEADPKMRPATPMAVAAALPGGDPLAAALAAGETPSPDLVANAGPIEGLRPAVAAACLVVVIVGLGLICILRQRHDLINQIPMENSSEVLAAKGREIARSFGYTEHPVDTLFAWNYDEDYLRYASEQKNEVARRLRLYAPHPPAVHFWYRQSPRYPMRADVDDELSIFDRDTLGPGMVAAVLDSEGRLLEFHARPPMEKSGRTQVPVADWSRLFTAAGLAAERFKPTLPELNPRTPFDAYAAWIGTWDDASNQRIRVEAASYQGHPVFFRVLGPWARPTYATPSYFGWFSVPMFVVFVLALPTLAGWMAWRNTRNGRGDRRGAFRLASFAFAFMLFSDLAGLHHVRASTEFVILFAAVRYAATTGFIFWILYMAFEPHVRRQSPDRLISWSRVLAGRHLDAMVGGHVLAGVTLGVLSMCAIEAFGGLPFVSTLAPKLPWAAAAGFLSLWFTQAIIAVGGGLSHMFVMNLISMWVRRKWLTLALFVLVMTLLLAPAYGTASFISIVRPAVLLSIIAFALARFGVVTAVALIYTRVTLQSFPLTTNWSTWYAHAALIALGTIVALALYGFATTPARRPFRRTESDLF
jgi:serine/threonine protein kinase